MRMRNRGGASAVLFSLSLTDFEGLAAELRLCTGCAASWERGCESVDGEAEGRKGSDLAGDRGLAVVFGLSVGNRETEAILAKGQGWEIKQHIDWSLWINTYTLVPVFRERYTSWRNRGSPSWYLSRLLRAYLRVLDLTSPVVVRSAGATL